MATAAAADAQPLEMTEAIGTAIFRLAPVRPLIDLVAAQDKPAELESPRLHRVARKSQLTERNADLRRPAVGVDVRHDLPDRVPARVTARRADAQPVLFGPRRIDVEHGPAQVVVKPVDHDLDEVRAEIVVAPDEGRAHGRRVVHLRADIQGVVVEQEPHLGALRRRLPDVGVDLQELGHRRRLLPRLVVQPAIDHDRRDPSRRPGRRHGDRVLHVAALVDRHRDPGRRDGLRRNRGRATGTQRDNEQPGAGAGRETGHGSGIGRTKRRWRPVL